MHVFNHDRFIVSGMSTAKTDMERQTERDRKRGPVSVSRAVEHSASYSSSDIVTLIYTNTHTHTVTLHSSDQPEPEAKTVH